MIMFTVKSGVSHWRKTSGNIDFPGFKMKHN